MTLRAGYKQPSLHMMPAQYQAVYRERQSMPAVLGFYDASQMSGFGLDWVIVRRMAQCLHCLRKAEVALA
jgi:hypothetical protein